MCSKLIKIGFVFVIFSFILIGFKNKDEFFNMIASGQLLDSIMPVSVEDEYKKLETAYKNYENNVNTFYGSLDYYYDNFIRKNRAMTTYLADVESGLKEMERIVLRLNNKCDNDSSKYECDGYKEILIKFIESYNNIVVDYNKVIDSFNEFAKSNFREEHIVENYESILNDDVLKIYNEIK